MNDVIFKKNSKVNHNMLYGSSTVRNNKIFNKIQKI